MARKRKPVDSSLGQRLLQSKLQILQGASATQRNAALGILTGRVASPPMSDAPAADSSPVAAPPPGPLGREEPARAGGPEPAEAQPEQWATPRGEHGVLVPRTVYLSERNVRDLDFVANALWEQRQRRPSRSAILRYAIEHLRAEVESGAIPQLGAELAVE